MLAETSTTHRKMKELTKNGQGPRSADAISSRIAEKLVVVAPCAQQWMAYERKKKLLLRAKTDADNLVASGDRQQRFGRTFACGKSPPDLAAQRRNCRMQ